MLQDNRGWENIVIVIKKNKNAIRLLAPLWILKPDTPAISLKLSLLLTGQNGSNQFFGRRSTWNLKLISMGHFSPSLFFLKNIDHETQDYSHVIFSDIAGVHSFTTVLFWKFAYIVKHLPWGKTTFLSFELTETNWILELTAGLAKLNGRPMGKWPNFTTDQGKKRKFFNF